MRNLVRWNPRNEIELADPFRAFDQFERFMDEIWRSWPSRFPLDTARGFLRPAMDVIEAEDKVTVRVDLPGLSVDDVHVEVRDNTLTISGEIGDTVEREGERYHFRERSYGAFQRSLRLPSTLDADKVEASFENGVLSVVLPKLPEAQPKQIKVKAGKK